MLFAGLDFTSIFVVKNTQGVLVNADNTVSASIYRNGVLTVVAVSVANVTTGIYSYSLSVPSNWVKGDTVVLQLSAVVEGFSTNSTLSLGTVAGDSADQSDIDALQNNLIILNEGLKKASIREPHEEDLV